MPTSSRKSSISSTMPCRFRGPRLLLVAAMGVWAFLSLYARAHAELPDPTADPRVVLYLVGSDPNAAGFCLAAKGLTCTEPNLVIVTHGWYEKRTWPAQMAIAIAKRVDCRQWRCGWYDWRQEAKHLRPSVSALVGRDETGPRLGDTIVALSPHWRHVHLIGHSAGAWVVNAAAEVIAQKTDAEIHITFLDAYVPDGWDEKALARLAQTRPERCRAEHYFTRDWLNLTENVLTGAHNVDITTINPGIRGHRFPWHWYLATIAGRYVTDDRLANAPVFCRAAGSTYGFPRSRETAPSQWQSSLAPPIGNTPVRIRPQQGRP